MANSVAYVLSKNTYPTTLEAGNVGISQGTRIVYATTSTLTTANILYADSRLTQPIYGDGENWYAVQLLTDTAVNYEITINENAVIDIFTAGYTIGQAALGGTIAYILQAGDPGYDADVQHGLVVTSTDVAAEAEWGCWGTLISGTSTALGTGNANTIAIMAACATAGIAARLCGNLTQGGYSDWYLPSKDELNKLYLNRVAIGGFLEDLYWTSSNFNSDVDYAWELNFTDGIASGFDKNIPVRVRAIRSF